MAKRNKQEFFIATQIELFLIIIFVVFLRASFVNDQNQSMIDSLAQKNEQLEKLFAELQEALAEVEALKIELSEYDGIDTEELMDRYREAVARADSLQIELTGTGIGNCLDKKLLADVYCLPNGGYRVVISIEEPISIFEERLIEPTTYNFTKSQFTQFGKDLLFYSQTRTPECRYAVRVFDSDEISKNDFKSRYNLISRYFYARISL